MWVCASTKVNAGTLFLEPNSHGECYLYMNYTCYDMVCGTPCLALPLRQYPLGTLPDKGHTPVPNAQ